MINKYLEKQRNFFATQQTKKIEFRLEALARLKGAIIFYQDQIIEALKKDLGKSKFESYETEISLVLSEIKLHTRKLKNWSKGKYVPTSIVAQPGKSYQQPEPYGQVLIISPWNYPFNLLFMPLIGAISAGNTIIMKPSELATNTAALFEEMINNYFSPKYIALINGGAEVSKAILKERFDYIFFTGSTERGRDVMRAAAEHLTPVTLELGGKSPCVVDYDANLDAAARKIIWGKFLNAGQTCVAPDYLMVHRDVKEELLNKMLKYLRKFYGPNPLKSPDYPRIISEGHFNRLCELIKDGVALTGGNCDSKQLYIAPTILDQVDFDSSIMKEEIFGPLLPVFDFSNLDDVADFINRREKPLALYYFSEDKTKQQRLIVSTSSGGCCINDVVMQLANHHLPFGGVGESGMGAYHGKSSFELFSHYKSVMEKPNRFDIPLRYPPYRGKLKLLKFLLG